MKKAAEKTTTIGRPHVLPKVWANLVEACGGVASFAEACAVSPMSVWRWGRGTPPSMAARGKIATLAKKHKLKNPLPAELRA